MGYPKSIDCTVGPVLARSALTIAKKGRSMKNVAWTFIAMVAVGAMGTTPAYASGGSTPSWCSLPIIGKLLCPPAPGGGGGSGTSVPEPATLAVLGAGAAAAIAARRRRNKK